MDADIADLLAAYCDQTRNMTDDELQTFIYEMLRSTSSEQETVPSRRGW